MSTQTRKLQINWHLFLLIMTVCLLYITHVFLLIYMYLKATRGLGTVQDIIPGYTLSSELITGMIFSIVLALIIGALEIYVFRTRLRRYAYGRVILIKIVLYSVVAVAIVFCSSLFYAAAFLVGDWPWKPAVIRDSLEYITEGGGMFIASMSVVATTAIVFIIQVDEKMGQGVLFSLLTGKYHRPKELTRIFMLLDMKSSTAIAEQLGHNRYYNLLNQYYADMTDPILRHKGEIYQYVGDEIVISWSMRDGIELNRCLNCFFAIQSHIQKNARAYEQRFGVVPEFKAGMHYGDVTAGEIGIVKRVITYSGDVLNTTARIQEMCNELGSKFIVSGNLLDEISSNGEFLFRDLGTLALRGKEQSISLSSVELS